MRAMKIWMQRVGWEIRSRSPLERSQDLFHMRKSLMYPYILYVVSASDACTCGGKIVFLRGMFRHCFRKFANFPNEFKYACMDRILFGIHEWNHNLFA